MIYLPELRQASYQTICLLFTVLFTYAAVSKVIDYDNFGVQLGQSPLLSAYAGWLMWAVPCLELLLAILLLFGKVRLIALSLSTGLMISFTVYILIILHWTPFVPCSCGGILEQLGWEEHLYFNLLIVIIGFLGIVFGFREKQKSGEGFYTNGRLLSLIALLIIAGGSTVYYMYRTSEYILHNDNSFLRTFIDQPSEVSKTDLTLNSYYFAGEHNDAIYLGNYTAPLAVEIMDRKGGRIKSATIRSGTYPGSLGKAQLRILGSQFYLIAANAGSIYSGSTHDWRIRDGVQLERPILKYTLIDTITIAATYLSPNHGESVLGKFSLASGKKISDNPSFLERQLDGVFDVDGSMVYDRRTARLVYSYYYRNEYMIAGADLVQKFKGKTIDTNSRAKIQIAQVHSRGERKLGTPPISVNKNIAVSQNLLFIQSELAGKLEPLDMWEVARVIDVYNVENGSYVSSFYIYNIGKEKLKSFFVLQNDLYAFIGNYLVRYQLGDYIISQYE